MAAATQLSLQGQGVILVNSASVTVSALAAAAEEDYTITEAAAAVGDVVMASWDNAGAETGASIVAAWVSQAGQIKVRNSNLNAAAALTGGTRTIRYCLIRAS